MNNRSRYQNQRFFGSRDSIDRRVDKLVEKGRQLVDGVSGNRPGNRLKQNRSNFDDMSRWVGKKIDWFFEDEDVDDWSNPLRSELYVEDQIPTIKRPLTAISLRGPKAISAAPIRENLDSESSDEWPDQSTFKVDRWERSRDRNPTLNEPKDVSNSMKAAASKLRSLPRSSRRRN